jgi:hypothetical protein
MIANALNLVVRFVLVSHAGQAVYPQSSLNMICFSVMLSFD